jgi:aspartyl-tRNA(Asn)/glutamyl-tRNA(Gln) amidotransferase subunit A
MSEEIAWMSATQMARRITSGELSPVEVVEALWQVIHKRNPEINAYVTLLEERSLQRALQAQEELARGQVRGPLHGVPVAIKDLGDPLAGVRNTFGSRLFADFVPEQSATYVDRLEAAGAVILGKTNTPEFGHKGVTDNLLFGPTRNPFDLDKNAGGSSGGAAAAVAAGMAPLAQGSDAGGSIRIPASWCGVYGFKASYGRVAAAARPDAFFTHTPFIHSGPLSRSVEDTALMLQVISGPHQRDPLSLPDDGVQYVGALGRSIAGWRIAYSPALDVFPVEPEVAAVAGEAVQAFAIAGANVEEVELGLKRPQEEWSDLWLAQMAALYAAMADSFKEVGIDMLARRDELSPEFAALIERGMAMSAVEYKRLDEKRTEMYDAVQDIFDDYDLLVCPTLAAVAGDNAPNGLTLGPDRVNGVAVDPTIGWCLTYPFNFTGHPAASLPAGLSPAGLPVGLQVVGRRFADDAVLAASAAFERVRPWAWMYERFK